MERQRGGEETEGGRGEEKEAGGDPKEGRAGMVCVIISNRQKEKLALQKQAGHADAEVVLETPKAEGPQQVYAQAVYTSAPAGASSSAAQSVQGTQTHASAHSS